jgi:hypothetical protein
MVRKYSNIPWCWDMLSIYIPIDVIKDNMDLPWDIKVIYANQKITIGDIRFFQGEGPLLYPISFNRFLTYELCQEFGQDPQFWGTGRLDRRLDLTVELVEWLLKQNFGGFVASTERSITERYRRVKRTLYNNHFPPLEVLKSFPDIPWKWKNFRIHGFRKNVVKLCDIVNAFPDKDWNWGELSFLAPSHIVRKYPDKPWNWKNILDLELVKDFPDKEWDWKQLSRFLKVEDILNNPNFPWEYEEMFTYNRSCYCNSLNEEYMSFLHLFYNKLFSKEEKINIVCSRRNVASRYLNLPNIKDMINWKLLSGNPNLTITILKEFPEKDWNWEIVRYNQRMWSRDWSMKKRKVRRIEEAWIECRDNPRYEVCFNMTLRDHDDEYTFEEWKRDRK